MRETFSRHKYHWNRKEFRYSVLIGAVLFALSILVSHLASDYANVKASNYVTDILLNNLPVMDVGGILNYGVMVFSVLVIYFVIIEPKRIPFVLKSLALFVIIRAAFITLTHLGPVPVETPVDPNDLFSRLISGSDYFFSGHTGMPYLIALIFWENKLIRNISIAFSVIFGASVILGHLHYSIDVFAAFFITFGIFHIARKIFPKEYALLYQTEKID